MFAFLYVKANSKEICEEISFPSFFRKMLMSAFLLGFKANYLEKLRGPNLAQKPLFLVGTVLN